MELLLGPKISQPVSDRESHVLKTAKRFGECLIFGGLSPVVENEVNEKALGTEAVGLIHELRKATARPRPFTDFAKTRIVDGDDHDIAARLFLSEDVSRRAERIIEHGIEIQSPKQQRRHRRDQP